MKLPEYSPAVYALLRAFVSDGHYQPSTEAERLTLRFLRQEQLLHDYMEPYGRRLSAKGLEALCQEDVRLAVAQEEAEKLAQKMADDVAAAERKEASDDAKAASDQRKQFRHDFKIALLSIAGTLLVERLDVILDFFSANIEKVFVLLGLFH